MEEELKEARDEAIRAIWIRINEYEETFKCSIVVPYIAVRRSEHFSPLVTVTGGAAPDNV